MPSAATTRSASNVVRPSPTAGRSPASARTLSTATPVRISTRSPRPAISASCRSSRCTTTGIRSGRAVRPGPHQPVTVGAADAAVGQRGGDGVQAGAEAEHPQGAYPVGPQHQRRWVPGGPGRPRSSRVTCQPERASAPAAASPPSPAPTTTARAHAAPLSFPVGGPATRAAGPVGPRRRVGAVARVGARHRFRRVDHRRAVASAPPLSRSSGSDGPVVGSAAGSGWSSVTGTSSAAGPAGRTPVSWYVLNRSSSTTW